MFTRCLLSLLILILITKLFYTPCTACKKKSTEQRPSIEEMRSRYQHFLSTTSFIYNDMMKLISPGQPKYQCGRRSRSLSNSNTKRSSMNVEHIIAGDDAAEGFFPWQAFMERTTEYGYGSCGAVILNKIWLLTAAHCLISAKPRYYFGITDLSSTAHRQVRGVVEEIPHQEYSRGLFHHDIALVKLDEPLEFTDYVKPICLPTRGRDFTEYDCHISGWGKTQLVNYKQQYKLQTSPVNIMKRTKCDLVYHTVFSNPFTDYINSYRDHHLCLEFGKANSRASACQGDSGGPVSCRANNDDSSEFYLAGIASFAGEGCRTDRGVPNMYTNVTTFLPWIEQTIYPSIPRISPSPTK